MKQTVYVDILLSVNIMTDCCLIRLAAKLAGRNCARARLCLASVCGALCSLTALLPPQPVYIKLLIAAASAGIMTLAAAGWVSARAFFKLYGCLLLVTACYGGIMSCLWLFVMPGGIIVNNGAVYIDIGPIELIVCAAAFYAVCAAYAGYMRGRTLERSSCRIRITRGGRSRDIDGMFDTGNMLREPFSGLPVIIAERRYIEELIPPSLEGFSRGENTAGAPEGVRIVPYSSVGGGGLMAAFMPDSVRVFSPRGERTARAYIGVSEESLGEDCHAVISPDALE